MKHLVLGWTLALLGAVAYWGLVPSVPVVAQRPLQPAGLVNAAIRPQIVLTTPTLPPFTGTPTGTPSWTTTVQPSDTPTQSATRTAGATGTTTTTPPVTVSAIATGTTTATPTVTVTATPPPICGLPSWHQTTLPITGTLQSVAAVGTDDVWAVGDGIIHWNGQRWQTVPYPTPTGTPVAGLHFTSVAAGAGNSVWAVAVGTNYTAIEHWNGSAWTRLPYSPLPPPPHPLTSGTIPSPSATPVTLYPDSFDAVSATGSNDAYVVGSASYPGVLPHYVVLYHCTASDCAYLTSSIGSNSSCCSNELAARSPSDIWIAGVGLHGGKFIDHWDGHNIERTYATLRGGDGLVAISANDVWAGTGIPALSRWDGISWQPAPAPPGTQSAGHTPLAARAGNDLWGAFGTVGVAHWDGTAWAVVPGQHAATVNSLSPLGPADVWAVGVDAQGGPVAEHYAALPTFSDVPAGDVFYPYIEWMACRTIISGYTCGSPEPCDGYQRPVFRSSAGVSRGQLLKMVTLSAGWPLVTPATPTFADVSPGSTFYTAIETGYAHGIISGYTCGGPGEPCSAGALYFRPSAPISRGQLSKVIALARAYPLPNPATPTFADVDPSNVFYGYIEAVAAHAIVSGYTCGTVPSEPCDPAHRAYFRPTSGATRGQVSKIVTLAYGGP